MRIFDILLSSLGLILLAPLLLLVWCGLAVSQAGSPLFRQLRVGRDEKPFCLFKFRTMKPGTAAVDTHRVHPGQVTPCGKILRKTKLDELPQLWNVLRGDMSLVGPRPCLPSQGQLIQARRERGVFRVRPGLTGLAQIRGIDMSTPERLAEIDAEMIEMMSPANYLRYVVLSILGRGAGDRILCREPSRKPAPRHAARPAPPADSGSHSPG